MMAVPGEWEQECRRRLARAVSVARRCGWSQTKIYLACGLGNGEVPSLEQQAMWLEQALLDRLQGRNEQYRA